MKITVVYNNIPSKENLATDWGFSAVIESGGKKVLFDAGTDGAILLSNMALLDINISDIGAVFLSHIHNDHTGGLDSFLDKNPNSTIYLPQSFSSSFKKDLIGRCEGVVEVKGPQNIFDNFWSTGELKGKAVEQSLVIDTDKGLVVIAGCAHPGILKTIKHIKKEFNKDIYLLIGGFHLGYMPYFMAKIVIKKLKSLGIQKVGPSHCNKPKAINYFKEVWKEDFIDLGCGASITI